MYLASYRAHRALPLAEEALRFSFLKDSFVVFTGIMTAAVLPAMSNPFMPLTELQVSQWMLAQMSSNYPEPPGPTQHYNALYPTSAGASQLIDPMQQDQLQFSSLNQPVYPKIESRAPEQPSANNQIQHLAQELHHHAALEEHQRQNIHHATQHMQQQASQAQPPSGVSTSQAQSLQGSSEQSNKANRLRKACDSCSIRKVKVWVQHIRRPILSRADSNSVTRLAHHVVLVRP